MWPGALPCQSRAAGACEDASGEVCTHLCTADVLQIVERDPTAPALDKREQDVTILFLDIAGYTSLSETLDQEKVNSIVERYFSSFLDDMYANRGDIKLVST